MVEIPVDKLREVVELLTDRIRMEGGVVAIEKEEFWSISPDQTYDVYHQPRDFTVGALSESWSHLEDMLSDPDRVVGHGFVWLAEVLRAIGDETKS